MNSQLEMTNNRITSEVRFYTVSEVMCLTGWSEAIILRLFNDPEFPSSDYGKSKIVEEHALVEFFSKKRSRADSHYWKKGDLKNELRKRARQ